MLRCVMLEVVGEGVSRAGHGQGLETVGEHEGEARGATKGGGGRNPDATPEGARHPIHT